RFRTKDNAGVELLALRTAATGGTTALDKDAFAKKLSKMGSDVWASSQHAYSMMAAKSLTEELSSTFELMSSAFLSPAMPNPEIELHRERMIVGIQQRDVTPDGRLGLLVTETMYG